MKSFVFDEGDIAEAMDQAKDTVVERLVNKGLLKKEDGDAFRKTHLFVLRKMSRISCLWARFKKVEEKEKNMTRYHLAEIPMSAEPVDDPAETAVRGEPAPVE